jgi:hypothetical protein
MYEFPHLREKPAFPYEKPQDERLKPQCFYVNTFTRKHVYSGGFSQSAQATESKAADSPLSVHGGAAGSVKEKTLP